MYEKITGWMVPEFKKRMDDHNMLTSVQHSILNLSRGAFDNSTTLISEYIRDEAQVMRVAKIFYTYRSCPHPQMDNI